MYLHVDINAYFATMLQQETPALRGRPLGIVKDLGRSCIIASSKEAKAKGVKTGTSRAEALIHCPELELVPADFELCLAATLKLKDVFANISPDIEIFSLDETFIPYQPLHRLYTSPQQLGELIQQRIKRALGEWVTCNVGIGPTRFLAKMTGETAPKGSITTVTEDNKQKLLATTKFADVCGIGHRLEKRLRQIGVTVPYQINFIPREDLERWFGPWWGIELAKMARGDEPAFLARLTEPPTQMQSVSRSITLFELARDEATIRRVLYNLASEVIYKVRRQQLAGRLVAVSLTGHDQHWGRHVTLRQPIQHTSALFQEIMQLYAPWRRGFPVIRFAIYFGLLQRVIPSQLSLLPGWWQRERLEVALDAVNNRYGLFTARSGLLATSPVIRPEVTGFFGDREFYLRH